MANKKKTTKAKATVLQGAVPTTIDPNSVQGFKDFQKASEELRSKGTAFIGIKYHRHKTSLLMTPGGR